MTTTIVGVLNYLFLFVSISCLVDLVDTHKMLLSYI